MDDTSNEYKTSIFDAVELQVNGILNPTLHEHSLLQSFVSVGIDNTDAKQYNEESKNVNKKARARHCLGKNEENNDLDNRETDNGDSNKTKRTNKRFKEKMDTSFIEVQVQMQKSRLKQRSNNAPRQEEIYTDKDRAAAVNMGSKDIKQSLKQKKRQDRDKSPLLSDIAEPGSVLELGKREMRLGNVNAAFNFINKALELSPNDANALIARSRCYLLLGNPQNALQDAETALQCKLKDSVNARAVYYKAEALYYLGDFEMSLVYYYRGMKMRPEFGQFRLGVQKAKDAIRNTCVRHMMDYIPELLIPPTTSDYQPITEKEASDLKQLIEGCDYAVSNAELFMETLSKDLSILDGENVRLVLGSEPQVAQLMKSIEAAVEEASMVEARLAAYDEALGRIREVMARVGQKNQAIHTANNNASFLLEQLSTAISQLDIPANYQRILNETDLPGGREELSLVGISLLKAMTAPLPLGLDKLSAVTEQKKRLEKLKTKFSVIVARHLNNLFIHLGNDTGENINSSELILPTHEAVHHELEPYTELMQLLRALDNKAFMQLAKVYRDTMSKLYKRDLKHFFEIAKNKLISKRLQAHASKGSGQKAEDLINPAPMCLLSAEVWPPISEGRFLDMVLDGVLSQMQPVCLAEQAFCISFLQLDSVLTPSNSNEMEETECVNNGAASPGSVTSTASKKLERQVNEEVRATMSAIFPSLETELNNFIAFLDKVDSFWCMYVLVRLSQHVMSAQDTGSFLSMTFASALIQVKRGFDKFMQAQQHSILMDTKVNRRHKCGILPYVANFGLFAKTAEKIFKHSDRKVDLEKWYTKLVGTIFEAIVIHSKEHHKTPPEVIKMENFHHMYDLLSQVKISVLDQERKEAKQRYQEALRAYVIQYFGRPLEKLNLFFEGVQAKVGAGVKESEISYQMAFSKLELRRVIKEYPAREVKKGLENLYRKVEKHLCEEENLLQVVWREMQGEFIAQYIYIEELVRRCYPDSMVTLEFTTQDILEFFSEIARSH